MIITRTPFRISFFGGGTDYPAWSREHGGAVLATTINKYCYISCRHLPPFFEHKHRIVYSLIENVRTIDEIRHPAVRAVLATMGVGSDPDGLEIHHDGDLPARSGLGSSSSFTVGLIHAIRALRGQYVSKDELAREAIHIEQDVIGENVGSQDQVSAAFGGLNRIGFRRDGSFDVAPVIVDPARLTLLQDHLMLCFTGISRIASEVARSKIDNLGNRHAELTRMREMVEAAIAILHDAVSRSSASARCSTRAGRPSAACRIRCRPHRSMRSTKPPAPPARSAASCSAREAAVSSCSSPRPKPSRASASGSAS